MFSLQPHVIMLCGHLKQKQKTKECVEFFGLKSGHGHFKYRI